MSKQLSSHMAIKRKVCLHMPPFEPEKHVALCDILIARSKTRVLVVYLYSTIHLLRGIQISYAARMFFGNFSV